MISFKETIRYCAVAAAIALLPASCCRPNISISQEEPVESRPIPIMIGAASTGTKAVIKSTGHLGLVAFNSKKGFGVYGYKYNTNNTYTLLFNNMEVKAAKPDESAPTEDTEWTWTYSPTRYWDSNPLVSYQFIAYWPKLPKSTEITEGSTDPYVYEDGNRVLTIYNIPNWQKADATDNCKDFMTAAERGRYSKTEAPFNDDYVKFNFNHLLSKIEVRAYYIGVKKNIVKVNSIKLSGNNIPLYEGNGSRSNYTEPFEGQGNSSYSTQRGQSSPYLYNKGNAVNGYELPEETFFDEVAAATDQTIQIKTTTISQWLVVPSNGWGNITLETSYNIGSATYTSQSTGITFDSGENNPSEMLPGKTYILTLKFDSSGGGLDVKTVWVNGWNEQTPISPKVFNW